jgi:hypothetical protein
MNSASPCSLEGRYDNPIPTRFLAPIYCLKIPALGSIPTSSYTVESDGAADEAVLNTVHRRKKEHACKRIEECSNMAEDCEGGVADARIH